MSELTKETSPTRDLLYGHVTVGLTAVQLSTVCNPLNKGVMIQSSPNNTAPVFLGRINVAADGTAMGYPLMIGATVVVPLDRLDQLWLISSSVDQSVAWISA